MAVVAVAVSICSSPGMSESERRGQFAEDTSPVFKEVGDEATTRKHSAPLNNLVLSAVRAMPEGGGYATNATALAGLRHSIGMDPDGPLSLHPEFSKPSFCSAATFLVLLSVFDALERKGSLIPSKEVSLSLMMKMQPDGTGIWGRWNANGPGTARLFFELKMGRNFSDLDQALPGDFLKIWWNDNIGRQEKGHSVIYISRSGPAMEESITFWSANTPLGYGYKTVPKSRIKRALFSRLERPEAIAQAVTLPRSDAYLRMARRPGTEKEMFEKVGILEEHRIQEVQPSIN